MNFHGLDFVEADLVNSFIQATQPVANRHHHVITETAALAFYIVRNLENTIHFLFAVP